MSQPEHAATATTAAPAVIPRLKDGLQFVPFGGDRSGEEYLLEVGGACYTVNRHTRDVLLALGERPETIEELAHIYTRSTGRVVSPAALGKILDSQIPAALLSHTPEPRRRTPFVFSFTILPVRAVRPFTAVLRHLYRTPLVVFFVLAFVVVECLVMPEALASFRGVFRVFSFQEFLLFYSAIVGGMLIHELGHASACRHYQCPHGPIGFGLYLIFPGLYTDVTSAWRLSRRQRTVVNLGGLYFQCIAVACVGLYAWLYGSQFWLRVVWITNFMMLYTLNPVLKQDGYWVLSDLSGLRNLHQQVRQTFAGLFNKASRTAAAPPQNEGLRRKVLYVYMLLVAAYMLYFVNFIYGAVLGIAEFYPPAAQAFMRMLGTAWAEGRSLEVLLILLRWLWASVLPLLLGVLLFSLCYRFLRHAGRRLRARPAGGGVPPLEGSELT